MKFGFIKFHVSFLLMSIVLILAAGCNKLDSGYFQGYVEGEYVYIASSGKGELEKLAVVKGQAVKRNALLFQLDPNPEALQIEEIHQRMQQARFKLADISKGSRPSELAGIKARLTRAQAALALAERDYHRRHKLYELGDSDTISEEELDRFQTEVNIRQTDLDAINAELKTANLGGRVDAVTAAEKEINVLAASLNTLEWQLGEKQVTAPSAGIIQDTIYRVGEFVPAGRPVITLLPPENLKIRFFVPQSLLPTIQPGTSVRVQLDGMESQVAAKISYISPEAEFTPPIIYSKESRTKLVFMVEAIPDIQAINRLRVGQPLEVYLN